MNKAILYKHMLTYQQTIGINFDLSNHLKFPINFVYASSEGSGESVHLRRLI